MPNGMMLNECVCDGLERPFCEVVKQNMLRLCSIGGFSVDHDAMDDIYEDEDYETKAERDVTDSYAVMSTCSAIAGSRQVLLLYALFALICVL